MRSAPPALLTLALAALLSACAAPEQTVTTYPCQVVVEQSDTFTAQQAVLTLDRGEDAVFTLTPSEGYAITGVDYEDATLSTAEDGLSTLLTLHNVRYSTVVTVETQVQGDLIYYDANGGQRLDGGDSTQPVAVAAAATHLRQNTALGTDLFTRQGYTLTGWNTAPDGTGESVGLGSRILWQEGLTLYAQWAPWTAEEDFTYTVEGGSATITGYTGHHQTLVIPGQLGGCPVGVIAADACAGADCTTLILPSGLRRVESGAFAQSSVESLTLFDDIVSITDYAFTGCTALRTLHINAVEAPVYSSSYFATFADKFDRLLSLAGERKLVLFSGSSTRFGYDSAALEEGLEGYQVVNMGVFAYTNALPQFLLILDCMQSGDILLHSPEFDAAQRQFCTYTRLEDEFFCMTEANYDLVSRLDLREVTNVFSALNEYLSNKADMTPLRYSLTPSDFDEDGNPVSSPSYNLYGDYCLYRPNAADDDPIYGLGVSYTVDAFPAAYLASYNALCQRFLDKGVRFYFTYAPRNQLALSEDSTPEARAALDAYFRSELVVPVISDLESSLYPGRYLYGTDNHLSTEGVALRTAQILQDITAQLAWEEQEATP
jgi:hypothetical protein